VAKKHDIRLIVKLTKDQYGDSTERFDARVVYMVDPDPNRPEDSGMRNPCTWDSEELASLSEFTITAIRNNDDTDNVWFGYDFGYSSPYRVDLRHAERMVKQLRKVTKRLAKYEEQFGSVTDLAGFCGRVATALDVTDQRPFGIYEEDLTMNGTHYRWHGVDYLRTRLREKI
jgi:hypothetical protein